MNNPNIVYQKPARGITSPDNHGSIRLSVTQLTIIDSDTQETIRVVNRTGQDFEEAQPVYCLVKAKVVKPRSGGKNSQNPSTTSEARIYLTPREKLVLKGLSQGLSYSETARYLSISENTLRTHIKHIYLKMGVNNRLQAVNKAYELALL